MQRKQFSWKNLYNQKFAFKENKLLWLNIINPFTCVPPPDIDLILQIWFSGYGFYM